MKGGEEYRADIDGLRAVAVVAVLLFHFAVPGFAGGYLGVDVFFVISGFLITRIIAGSAAKGSFSYRGFYERRVRRIIPALFAVLLATTVAAWVLLLPLHFFLFARSLIATLVFASNLYFARTADYFDPPAAGMPLLHSWSLAVEEQFYLLYPAVLIFLLRRGPGAALRGIAALFLLSLTLHIAGGFYAPRWTFYLMPTRFWQLMLGALLALGAFPPIATRFWRELLSLAGLAAIVTSVNVTATPVYGAVAAALGAALLIHANSGKTLARWFLSRRPVVFVGLISYSLYLWHWPLLAFSRYVALRPLTQAEEALLAASCFAIAVLSWRFVEQPFRGAHGRLTRGRLLQYAGGVAALLLVAAGSALVTGGWPQRLDAPERRIASFLGYGRTRAAEDETRYGTCYLNAIRESAEFWQRCGAVPGRTNLLLWGDSHAAHYFPGLRQMADGTRFHIAQANRSGCPPMGNAEPECVRFAQMVREHLAQFDGVILSARWRLGTNLPGLKRLVEELVARGLPVVLFGPSVEYQSDVPHLLVNHLRRGGIVRLDPASYEVGEVRQLDAKMRSLFGTMRGVTYISVRDALCAGDSCPLLIHGVPVHYDYGHLTAEGSQLVGKRIWPQIAAAMTPTIEP